MFYFFLWGTVVLTELFLVILFLNINSWLTKVHHTRFIEATEQECYLNPWHFERIEHAVQEGCYKVLHNEEGILVGYILYLTTVHMCHHDHPESGDKILVLVTDYHILRIGIQKEYRKQGYGKKIFMTFVEDLESRKNFNNLWRLFVHIRRQDYNHITARYVKSLVVGESYDHWLQQNNRTSTKTHVSFGWKP
jgi:ribosomal protein S18 acetylase RimI-like enzyme